MTDEDVWVSRVVAARIIGCTTTTVDRLIERGDLPVARPGSRNVRSLRRSDVDASAEAYAERLRTSAKRKLAREGRAVARSPEPAGGPWLNQAQAGRILGVTGQAVGQMARRERIPHLRLPDGRIRLRLDHVVVVACCRAVRKHPELLIGP